MRNNILIVIFSAASFFGNVGQAQPSLNTNLLQIDGTLDHFIAIPAADYPVGSTFTTQLVGTRAATLEYPEFIPLTRAEIKQIKETGIELAEQPVAEFFVGMECKQPVLEISFMPFAKRGEKYYRVASVKITPQQKNVAKIDNFNATRAQAPRLHDDGGAQTARYAAKSVLAEGRWVKIHVTEEGVHKLTSSQLNTMGFKDIDRVRVYGYGGRSLPETFVFDGPNGLIDDLCEVPLWRENDGLLFFAEGVTRWTWDEDAEQYIHEPSPYSQASYYFVTEGNLPMAFPVLESASAEQTLTSVPHHALYENDAYAWFGGGRNFVDGNDLSTSGTRTFSLSAPGHVAGTRASINVACTAAGATSSTPVTIKLGSKTLGSMSIPAFSNNENAREVIRTYNSDIFSSNNSFVFSISGSNPTRLDYIRATYTMELSAQNDGIAFSPCSYEAVTLKIADATTSTQLWRVGEDGRPTARVPATLTGSTLTATVADGMARYVIVDTKKGYKTPVSDGAVANQNLHGDTEACDMVIIIAESGVLKEQAERLADFHRKKEGLRVKVVNSGLIYNEFSSGTPDASAYRRYVKMLYDRATTAEDMPRFLLLFGDCFYDNRGVTAEAKRHNLKDFLLAFEPGMGTATDFAIGTLNSYVTDDYFGLLDDGEGGRITREKTDIAIGRIPVHDATTAALYVDKLIAYCNNETVGSWKNRIIFIGDDADNNLHMKGAESAAQIAEKQAGAVVLKRVYPDATKRVVTATYFTYPEASEQMLKEMDKGALMFNYTGHGGPTQLSHARLLVAEDFVEHAGTCPALWAFASCEITPYDQQEERDLGRMSLFSREGGAIAVMCSSRAVYASYNSALNDAFCQNVFSVDAETGRRRTMGEALRICKNSLITTGRDATYNKLKYAFLGDPAVVLSLPTGSIVLDSINGQALTHKSFLQLKAGEIVRFSGHVGMPDDAKIVDESFNGEVTATLFDRLETVTCLNNAKTADSPMTYEEHIVQLYEGRDSVLAGRFSFEVRIPLSLSYSDDAARLVLYAVNNERDKECHGENKQFHLDGTAENILQDDQGPVINASLGDPDGYIQGGVVGSTIILTANISDESGINTSSTSVGHDMELIIDGKSADVKILNDYFQYDFNSYKSGTLSYPLTGLSEGRHMLTLRVWDVFGNSNTVTLAFTVRNGQTSGLTIFSANNPAKDVARLIVQGIDTESTAPVAITIYDLHGRRIWTRSVNNFGKSYAFETWNLTTSGGAPVIAGIYILKATQGSNESSGVKVIVTK